MKLHEIKWEVGKKYKDSSGKVWTVGAGGDSLDSLICGNITRTYTLDLIAILEFAPLIDPVDWENIPIDTNVLVSIDKAFWSRRHFGGIVDGKPVVYGNGRSSFTAADEMGIIEDTVVYEYIKLYEE